MKNKFLTKVGVLTACSCSLSYLAFSPIIASIAASFPETDISLVQMIITLPSFMFIIFSPLAGKLAQKVEKKTLAVIAILLYLAGGLLSFFLHSSIWQILAGSLIIGCGSGLLMPVLNSIICDCFDGAERGQIMGLNATFVALGAMLMIFISGQLSRFGWHMSFLSFLILIPVLIVVLAFLPKSKAAPALAKQGADTHNSSGFEMTPIIAFLFVIGVAYFSLQNAYNTNSSLYLSDMNIGVAEVASYVTMVNSLGGIFGGMLFGWLVTKAKAQVETVALLLSSAGFLLTFFLPQIVPILVGSALVGAGFALFNASGTFLLSKYLKPENNAFTASIYLAVVNLGASLSPVVVNNISGLFGESTAVRYLTTGILIGVCAVISFLVSRGRKLES